MADAQQLFTAAEAAAFMRYEPTTLAVWRSQAKGPEYLKLGRTIRYRLADLEAWLFADLRSRWIIEQNADCHIERRSREKRLRGRAAGVHRDRHLEAEPFCRDCKEYGVERLAEEVDHILPLADGGTNSPDNLRSLCRGCHRIRTRERLNKKS